MDFERVLRDLGVAFAESGIRYALIGGFALGALGVGRATMDLDFLVYREDLPRLDRVMAGHQYRIAYRSDNVTQYVSDLRVRGQVDVLHAFRPVALAMLGRARRLPVFEGALELSVLEPGDLIGLKVQALVNDPARTEADLRDIRDLGRLKRDEIDWSRVREYFELFGRGDLYIRLREEIDHAD